MYGLITSHYQLLVLVSVCLESWDIASHRVTGRSTAGARNGEVKLGQEKSGKWDKDIVKRVIARDGRYSQWTACIWQSAMEHSQSHYIYLSWKPHHTSTLGMTTLRGRVNLNLDKRGCSNVVNFPYLWNVLVLVDHSLWRFNRGQSIDVQFDTIK